MSVQAKCWEGFNTKRSGLAIKMLTRSPPDLTYMLDAYGGYWQRGLESAARVIAKLLAT